MQQATREATTDASGKIIESTLMGQRIIDRLVGKHTGVGLKSLKTMFSPEQLKEIFKYFQDIGKIKGDLDLSL